VKLEPPAERPLWLASRSQRRKRLLDAARIPFIQEPAGIDDGRLRPGPVCPEEWVTSLAYLKARWVFDALVAAGAGEGTVLGADTVCVHEGTILGQPATGPQARAMLERLRDATHVTMTGVCLISVADGRRWLGVDRADVQFGHVSDDELEAYVASDAWRGKAGAYNLDDRVEAGWPIQCTGDPATVMGLPMTRLEPWLAPLRTDQGAPSP